MSTSSAPNAPDPAKLYKQGIQIYLANLPKMLAQEQGYRSQYDPQRVAAQQGLQAQYGPTQYNQQLQALQQLDPTGTMLQQALGSQIGTDLNRGYVDPRQNALYNQLSGTVGQNLAQGALSPEQAAAYKALGQNVTTQMGLGTQLDPAFQRQLQQDIRAGQSARGNIYGNAATSAEALYQGQRAQQLQQQRIGNVQNYLQLQNPAQGSLNAGLGLYGQQTPNAGALAQAGGYLGLQSPEQRIGAIQGVAPDRSSAYVNPNAGYQGQQFGLQNYQNQLANYSAGGGSQNPWAGALGAVAGTVVGGYFGGPAGAQAGGAAGGATGSYLGSTFSDARLKENIVRTGTSRAGVPIFEFTFKDDPDKRRFRGTVAQELMKTRWDAVHLHNGALTVDYHKLDIPFEEVK
jgi:hypothetical protein